MDKATRIEVELHDVRIYFGEIVGNDPFTDIAVVKNIGDSLMTLSIDNSENQDLGQLVIAIINYNKIIYKSGGIIQNVD